MIEKIWKLLREEKAQSAMALQNTLIAIVVAGTVGFVGLQVMETVIETTALDQNDTLYNASEELQLAIGDAYGLVGVAFLVIILGTIVFYLRGVR